MGVARDRSPVSVRLAMLIYLSNISTLQLLVSVEPAGVLGREGTAVRMAIHRGLPSNPLETGCLCCPAAMRSSPVCLLPTVYTAAGNGAFPAAVQLYIPR